MRACVCVCVRGCWCACASLVAHATRGGGRRQTQLQTADQWRGDAAADQRRPAGRGPIDGRTDGSYRRWMDEIAGPRLSTTYCRFNKTSVQGADAKGAARAFPRGSPVLDEERMRPAHRLGSVLSISCFCTVL